jgi:hypothetical protein
MISELPKRRGKLDVARQAEFLRDVESGLSDIALARLYDLTERTATNWRVRLFGRRRKGDPSPMPNSSGPHALQGVDGGRSHLSTGVNQQIPNNDTTPSPSGEGIPKPDGGK